MKPMAELQKQVHLTALNKGWWEADRNVGEMLALVHSEISEAFECWDHDRMTIEIKDGKPEGFPVEIADVVIRAIDIAESRGVVFKELPSYVAAYSPRIPIVLNRCHKYTSDAVEAWRMKGQCDSVFFEALQHLLNECVVACGRAELVKAIELKTAFNETRPYRHGGKHC